MKLIKFLFFRGLILLLCGVFLFACQEDNQTNVQKELQEKKILSFSKEIQFPKIRNIVLLPEAKDATSQWLAFITAKAEVKRFEKFTIEEAAENAETVQQIMTAFEETVPTVFQTKPVLARLNVLVTLSKTLQQTASSPNATAAEIERIAQKIPVAFENLKIQLNEVFRKGIEDFEFELDQKADSLKIQAIKDTLLSPISD